MTYRILFLLIISASFFSCSKSVYSGLESQNIVIYPAPPDTARIQFLTRISSSQDIPGSHRSFNSFITGVTENIIINKPYGIAVHLGKILICDTYIRGLDIIDMGRKRMEQFIPKGKGELKVPVNCFADRNGYIYIADSERKQIVVFDQNGRYINCFGDPENFKPVDVFIRDDKIWVTNLAGRQINVYSIDSTYELLNRFPEEDFEGEGKLFSPTNIYVTDSEVYVTDFGDYKVKVYSHDGKYLRSVGSYGAGLGQLARPKGIAVDLDNNLFVVDAGFENTQIFSKEGNLLMFFGGPYKGPGDMWLPAKVTLDYDNLRYFQKFVDPGYNLKYLILVTNQFGPDKLNIYGAVDPVKKVQQEPEKKEKIKRRRQGPIF